MLAPPFPVAVIVAARDAAKAHLRIDDDGEDALVERLAVSALALCEAFTGTAWITRAHRETLAAARGWQKLGAAPVTAITSVEGVDQAGTGTTLPVGSYAVDIDGAGEGWVRWTAAGAGGAERGLRLAYGAGAAAGWGDLPPPIAQGVVLLTAHLFDQGEARTLPPAAVSALWRPWRRINRNPNRRHR